MRSYYEIKAEYPKLFKKYPDVSSLYREDEEKKVILTKTEYEKVNNKWVEVEKTEEMQTFINYYNAVDPSTVAFFKGLGGIERVEVNYTKYGKIPTSITSISPLRESRTDREYKFI